MSKKPISLTVAIVGSATLAWIAACGSKSNGTTPTSTSSSTSTSTTGSTSTGTTGTSTSSSTSTSSGATDSGGGGNPALQIDNQSALTGAALTAGSDLTALIPTGDSIGTWYTYGWNAAAGALVTPAQGTPFAFETVDSGTPPKAACVTSTGYIGYSAGEGFNFATTAPDAGSNPVGINISSFTGITFLAMSSTSTSIEVKFPDDQTNGSDLTAACQDAGANASQCNNDFNFIETLTPTWTSYTVPFSALAQSPDFGEMFAAIDLNHVFGIQFEDEGSGEADGSAPAFNICIADLSFTQ